jgi:hypothetical protein
LRILDERRSKRGRSVTVKAPEMLRIAPKDRRDWRGFFRNRGLVALSPR